MTGPGNVSEEPQPSRQQGLKRALALVIEVAIIGAIVWVIASKRDELAQVFDLGPVDVAWVMALLLVGALVRGLEFQLVLRALRAEVTFFDAFALTQTTTLLNYLPMQAGTIIRARALKKYRSLSYARYVSMMSALILVTTASGGALGLIALIAAPSDAGELVVQIGMGVLFVGVLLLSIATFFIPPGIVGNKGGWFRRKLFQLLSGWKEICADKARLAALVGLGALKLLLIAGRFHVCFGTLNLDASFLLSVLLATSSAITMVVNVTPGSVGVRELIVGALGRATGMSFVSTLAAASLDRVLSLVFVIFAGGFGMDFLRARRLL